MTNIELPFEEHDESASPPARRGLSLGSIVLLIGVAAVAVVFGIALIRQNQTQPTSGAAPDFTLTTYDGDVVKLSDLRGKVVILNFWASWCGPCREEAPALQKTWERYQEQGVTVLGVAYTDTDSKARAFMDEYDITYPNGADTGTRISDWYNIQGVPETFIIDQDGNIARFYISQVDEDILSTEIERLLRGEA